jgi:hypothetical protein
MKEGEKEEQVSEERRHNRKRCRWWEGLEEVPRYPCSSPDRPSTLLPSRERAGKVGNAAAPSSTQGLGPWTF